MLISDAIVLFIDYLRVEKKYSQNTIIAYDIDLNQFKGYLGTAYDQSDTAGITHLYIRSWIVALMSEDLHAASANRKISSLRSWYKFMIKRELVSLNPMIKIVAPKKPKRLPITIPSQNMEQLLSPTIGKEQVADPFTEARDGLIMLILYSTGMRRAELIGLNINDIHSLRKEIKVTGKGNKVRLIPMTQDLARHINDYLELRAVSIEVLVDAEAVLVTASGKRIYPRLVHDIVHRRMADYTTSTKKSPHVLRHTFATHMLDNGADLNAIKEILGHASLAATQVYTHNSISRLKEAYGKAHPRSVK